MSASIRSVSVAHSISLKFDLLPTRMSNYGFFPPWYDSSWFSSLCVIVRRNNVRPRNLRLDDEADWPSHLMAFKGLCLTMMFIVAQNFFFLPFLTTSIPLTITLERVLMYIRVAVQLLPTHLWPRNRPLDQEQSGTNNVYLY